MTFLYSTLSQVYHFDQNSWPNIRFRERIDNSYIGWVVGMAISETNPIPAEQSIAPWMFDSQIYLILGSILLFILGLSLGMLLQKHRHTKSSNLSSSKSKQDLILSVSNNSMMSNLVASPQINRTFDWQL